MYLAALFFVCMVCHGELARRKPAPRYLTEFYLLIAAGGALGGLFVAVVAPLLLSTYFEWPIGLVGSALCARAARVGPGRQKRLLRYLVVGPAAAMGLWFLVYWEFDSNRPLDRARNFFGVISVLEMDRRRSGQARIVSD